MRGEAAAQATMLTAMKPDALVPHRRGVPIVARGGAIRSNVSSRCGMRPFCADPMLLHRPVHSQVKSN